MAYHFRDINSIYFFSKYCIINYTPDRINITNILAHSGAAAIRGASAWLRTPRFDHETSALTVTVPPAGAILPEATQADVTLSGPLATLHADVSATAPAVLQSRAPVHDAIIFASLDRAPGGFRGKIEGNARWIDGPLVFSAAVTQAEPSPPSPPAPQVAEPQQKMLNLPSAGPKDVQTVGCRVPAPEYPRKARRMAWEGSVLIRLVIDSSGKIQSATVARSSGNQDLDEAARKAVMAASCSPYLENGRAISVRAAQPVSFRLNR